MVTVLGPTNRRVSIWASTTVDWPGASLPVRAVAVTHPQETRTLAMCTDWPVLLVRRYGWVSIGPRGTEPKSRTNSSNMPSAQVAAGAGAGSTRPTTAVRQNRNIGPFPPCRNPAPAPGGPAGPCEKLLLPARGRSTWGGGRTAPAAAAAPPIPYRLAHR